MATSKTIVQNYQYINNATPKQAITSITVEPIVSGGQLVVSPHYLNPGVFTPGTLGAPYGNPQQP